jgi:hypothetical protein
VAVAVGVEVVRIAPRDMDGFLRLRDVGAVEVGDARQAR